MFMIVVVFLTEDRSCLWCGPRLLSVESPDKLCNIGNKRQDERSSKQGQRKSEQERRKSYVLQKLQLYDAFILLLTSVRCTDDIRVAKSGFLKTL